MASHTTRMMGIAIGLLLLVLAMNYGCQQVQKPAQLTYEQESQQFVDTLIPELAASWNPEVLLEHATPDLLSATPRPVFESMCRRFATKLGSLQKYLGSTGEVQLEELPEGQKISAEYKAHAEFEKGNGVLLLNLVRQDGQWRIQSFFMNAPALMKPSAP